MESINLLIIIPVFNEEKNIPGLLNSLEVLRNEISSEFALEVIFVDDGSSDNTSKLILSADARYKITLLKHQQNLGPGAVFATAFNALAPRLTKEDWVVTMEGDSTSRIDTLIHMLQRRKEGYDVILASPYAYGGGIVNTNLFRVILSHCANGFLKGLLGIHGIHTMSSFFRLYSGRAIRMLQKHYGDGIIETSGFECMAEMLMKMICLKLNISEVPMELDSSCRQGKSKMKITKTIVGYLGLFFLRPRISRGFHNYE